MAVIISCIYIMITFVHGADITLSIPENEPIGYIIDSVQNCAIDNLSPASSGLIYSFRKTDQEYENFFTMSKTRGTLSTAREIDREALCPHSESCILNLLVYANDTKREAYTPISVSVNILDVNDNKPIFPVPIITRNISEDADIGSAINISDVRAVDHDYGELGVLMYSINGVAPFAVTFDKKSSLQLIVNQRLDHETQALFSFVLTATDSGVPRAFSDSVVVNILVTDINDNAPIFATAAYNAILYMDDPIGFPFLNVSANDLDCGENGRVTYMLSPANDESILEHVRIDPDKGYLTLEKPMEVKTPEYYRILVTARDSGIPTQNTSVNVYVTILATVSNTTNPTPPGNPDYIPLFAIIAVVAVAVIVTGILAMYMFTKFRGKVHENVTARTSEPNYPDAAEYALVNYSEMNQDTTLTFHEQNPASTNQSDNSNPTAACIDNDRNGSSNTDLEEYLNPYQPLTANRESDSHLYASTNTNTNGLPTNVGHDNAVEEQTTDLHYYMTVLE